MIFHLCFLIQDTRALSFLSTFVFDIYNLDQTDDDIFRVVITDAKLRTEQICDRFHSSCFYPNGFSLTGHDLYHCRWWKVASVHDKLTSRRMCKWQRLHVFSWSLQVCLGSTCHFFCIVHAVQTWQCSPPSFIWTCTLCSIHVCADDITTQLQNCSFACQGSNGFEMIHVNGFSDSDTWSGWHGFLNCAFYNLSFLMLKSAFWWFYRGF